MTNIDKIYIYIVVVRLLTVLRGHSFFSSPPQRLMTSDFEWFSNPDFIHNIYFPILILEKEPVFPFLMFSAKQRNYLVPWHGPWLGIEPGTSRIRCHHSTTRLSRRRYTNSKVPLFWPLNSKTLLVSRPFNITNITLLKTHILRYQTASIKVSTYNL